MEQRYLYICEKCLFERPQQNPVRLMSVVPLKVTGLSQGHCKMCGNDATSYIELKVMGVVPQKGAGRIDYRRRI